MTRPEPLATLELADDWQAARLDAGPDSDGRLPRTDALDWFAAEVPGAIQYDLIRLGRLSNPFAGSEAVANAEWVHQTDWLYTRRFDFDPAMAAAGDIYLEVDGIDTFADLWLNGSHVGTTANAYRSYRFAIAPDLLRATDNSLVVHVKAHKRMVAHMVPEAEERLGPTFKYKGLIRRYQRSFFAGSSLLNLGGEILGIGIYKPMRLVVLADTRIEDVHFRTLSVARGAAKAAVEIALNRSDASGRLTARLIDTDGGDTVAEAKTTAASDKVSVPLAVADPKLWWPRGYGAQNRYRLEVVLERDGAKSNRSTALVGLRTSRIVTQKPGGQAGFEVHVNGVPIHCRGYNTIPVDYIKVHGSREANLRLIRLAVESNANMLRIWGGGAIESPEFYEACDELGIMIWQDFYLHSTTYPDWDEAWVAEYRRECTELLTYLRNHPALTVVCGGNELYEGWDEWGWRAQIDRFYGERLFTEVGKQVAAEITPDLPYVLNSPHGGGSCQSPRTGEVHNWGNFYNSTKDPNLVTETCWSQESYSRAETLAKVMDLNLSDFETIGWPGKWEELTGRGLITRLPYSGGPLVTESLAAYLKCLEIEQALADHHALTNLMMRSPSMTGLLYWPLNKGGPLFQFGAVDYLGYPLASLYVVKRLFADQVVTIYRDMNDIRVIAANRALDSVSGVLVVTHQKADGTIVRRWTEKAKLPAAAQCVRLTDIAGYYKELVDRDAEIMKAQLVVDGETVSEETLFFTPLMEFVHTPDTVSASVRRTGNQTWEVEINASSVVKLFYLEGNQKYLLSDNYFALTPDAPRVITVTLLERTSDAPPDITAYCMDSSERHLLSLS